jgi:hypothetical protein
MGDLTFASDPLAPFSGACAEIGQERNSSFIPRDYRGFHVGVRQTRTCKRAPWLYETLTPPSPGGGFAH